MFTRPANWAKLTWQHKRDLRFNKWISGEGIKFVNKEAPKTMMEAVEEYGHY